MTSCVRGRLPILLLPAFAALLLLAGCGSSDEDAPTGSAAAPSGDDFPAADGRTLEQIAADYEQSDLAVVPASSVFNKGVNRFGFGVFTIEREPIREADIALYVSRGDGPATGPYPAAAENLDVSGPFQSISTASDPEAAEVVYASELDLPKNGQWFILALVKSGDSYEYASVAPGAMVGRFPDVPVPGEEAPVIDTPTSEDVGGDLSKIDTRQPPSSMHDINFADVVGNEPVVLLFATPALCSSRVCGPVVDIAEEVKSERGDEAAFIHQEIFRDNDLNKGLRPQVAAYNLPSEPWLFVIDGEGKVDTAIEGAFSKGELVTALDKVSGGGES